MSAVRGQRSRTSVRRPNAATNPVQTATYAPSRAPVQPVVSPMRARKRTAFATATANRAPSTRFLVVVSMTAIVETRSGVRRRLRAYTGVACGGTRTGRLDSYRRRYEHHTRRCMAHRRRREQGARARARARIRSVGAPLLAARPPADPRPRLPHAPVSDPQHRRASARTEGRGRAAPQLLAVARDRRHMGARRLAGTRSAATADPRPHGRRRRSVHGTGRHRRPDLLLRWSGTPHRSDRDRLDHRDERGRRHGVRPHRARSPGPHCDDGAQTMTRTPSRRQLLLLTALTGAAVPLG